MALIEKLESHPASCWPLAVMTSLSSSGGTPLLFGLYER